MTLSYIEGDLLEIRRGVICHQVNMFKAWGAGLALQMKLKWPNAYKAYHEHDGQLGEVLVYWVGVELYIASLYGQYAWGGLSATERKTHYGALSKALLEVSVIGTTNNLPVYIPYKMGAGLAGGNWEYILELIEFLCPNAIIVHRPGD